ncbi:histidine phosphatase family protein [Sulfuricurvum sp.]|uniref:histidine phosphatase family protein n=1 Tax=Sulfuricurvum sp. TaxID=2025608 RepID=UPI003562F226
MELTLLRHAPPTPAYHGRYIGHTDIRIDEALFEHDKIKHLIHQQYDRVYSSDLVRCTATLQQMGFDHFITDTRLREVRFKSSIEGKNFAEIEAMEDFDPASLDSQERWHRTVCDEPLEAFRGRIQSFLDELPKNERILICSHAGTITMLMSLLNPEIVPSSLGYLDHVVLSYPQPSFPFLG